MSKHDSPLSRNSLVDTLAVWLEENGYMVAICKHQATAWGVTATFHTERLANQLDTAEGHE